MMITQTPQTAPTMLSWDDAVSYAFIDLYNGNGIPDSAARTIADAFKSPNTPALVALAQGTDVDTDLLRYEVYAEQRAVKAMSFPVEDDLVALDGLVGWIDDRESGRFA